ncbi:MAG: N-glycosylase/DNA lyase [Candidatus Micrarchaeota archaeon]
MNRGKELAGKVLKLKREIGPIVDTRVAELKANSDWFSEMCFCLLTANYTADGGIRIQKKAGNFSKKSLDEIRVLLKECGHRFPNARAAYIHEGKKHKNQLACLSKMANSSERREWLVKNVKGLGYKEASHFLRNVGYMDVAIIDRHILNILAEYGLIKKPKNLNRIRYLKIEKVLENLAKETKLSQGELDFYLWYMKTGKVLK